MFSAPTDALNGKYAEMSLTLGFSVLVHTKSPQVTDIAINPRWIPLHWVPLYIAVTPDLSSRVHSTDGPPPCCVRKVR